MPVAQQLLQALAQSQSCSTRSHAVEVGPSRSSSGRSVGHFAGVRGGDPYPAQRQAQLCGHHLSHLDVQPLTHLCAAVVQQHAAVGIDMNQCAGLIELRGRK